MAKENWRVKEPKRCVFCNGTGMTKEHVVSKWMGPYFPTGVKHFNGLTRVQTRAGASGREAALSGRLEHHSGAIHSRTIKNVCRACNGGWMKRIVDDAKPWLEPVLRREPVTLTREGQKALAAWASLSAIMAEYTDPEFRAVPDADREIMRATRVPPPTWTVSLARCDETACAGTQWGEALAYRHLGLPRSEYFSPSGERVAALDVHVQVTTVVMHSLVIQTASFADPGIVARYRVEYVPFAGLAQVWPGTTDAVAIPLPDVRDAARMDQLSEEFVFWYLRLLEDARFTVPAAGEVGPGGENSGIPPA